VLSLRHLYRHQLKHSLALLDELRVFLFTNFTKKLLKVIISKSFNLILLHLRLVPLLKTGKMHHSTGTRALARATQKLFFSLALLHHAILALSWLPYILNPYSFVLAQNTINQHQFRLDTAFRVLPVAFYRGDEEFFLPQFQKTPLLYIYYLILILYPMLYWF